MRRLPLVAALFALAVAPAAGAKGPVSLDICGAEACKTFKWDMTGRANEALAVGILDLKNSFNFGTAPPLGPYYELTVRADWFYDGGHARLYYVPAGEVVGTEYGWRKPDRKLSAELRAAVLGVRPVPPPALTRVLVDGREVDDPRAYTTLLGPLREAEAAYTGKEVEIVFASKRRTPWTDSNRPIRFVPSADVIQREADWFAVPADVAAIIERDAGQAAAPTGSAPTGSVRGDVAAALAAIAVAGLLALTLTRRRSRAPVT